MKSFLVSILFFYSFLIKAQTISNLQYSALLMINDNFPDNASKVLDEKGFVMISQEKNNNEMSFIYSLKKYDPYFYRITLRKMGGMQDILLMFNENSKITEYDPFIKNIKEFMTLQPKTKNGDSRFTVYKDNNDFYYAYYSDLKGQSYMISIMNYSSYYRFYVKDKE